ncbi:MAG: oligopeptide transporter, OPT family [Ignavibacteria bacterium]|nr:oligopeptide transporter, OPT family [Ignavibacteria bacterium]
MNNNKPYVPFVPANMEMKEFTLRALILGLIMSVVLGAANAYLGLRAGMTIAATYPAAVMSMAFLRLWRNRTILEENFARTVGSIGESVAAGAIFTIPAFVIVGIWADFSSLQNYLESSFIMLIGGVIGILFVAILRRVMVSDRELPFPESVAAGEIHKAGQRGGSGAKFLFWAMGLGGLIQFLKQIKFFAPTWEKFVPFIPQNLKLGKVGTIQSSGGALLTTPGVSPAYMGVGYIIGPTLAALNFTGGLLAWGLFVPLLLFFLGPEIARIMAEAGTPIQNEEDWGPIAVDIWRNFVRPVAIGGMLMSAGFTLWRMRKSLIAGLSRAVSDVKKAAGGISSEERTERDLPFKWVFIGVFLSAVATFIIYYYFSDSVLAAAASTIVMILAGFFFAAVSGYLVGLIGSSNNPISGLTISTLIVAALLLVILGVQGTSGIAAVLGVAAVICVSSAVAGEMLQDLKVGHILGGTPWKMQVGNLFGVLLAAFVMFLPLYYLHESDRIAGGEGLGGKTYPAPQASLMAILAKGIVGGEMAWPLIIVGMLMAFGFILLKVRSPMLVCVGMYLPLETSFAIFIGGLIRGILDKIVSKKNFNEAQQTRISNVGILLAAGLIAGEAITGLLFAIVAVIDYDFLLSLVVFKEPTFLLSLIVFLVVAFVLIFVPTRNAGSPDEPAPPSAIV